MRDRDLFDIVVGEDKTLAKFLLDNGGEGTERRVVDGCCLSVVEGGKPQERVALWRETFESSLGSSKLSPLFQKWYDLKDTPTRRASVYVGLCCLSAVEGEKPQERVALWRETFESWLESSKLSPF